MITQDERDRLWVAEEISKCAPDDPTREKPWRNVNACGYFIDEYVKIYDEGKKEWIPFKLWPEQWDLLEKIMTNGRVCVLKGRQLGITWLCLGYAQWLQVCLGGVSIALFSKGESEAQDLLRRLRGMYAQLPPWMTAHMEVVENPVNLWVFKNDTKIRAMSTKGGDGFQFTFGLVDEAALIPDLKDTLIRLKPALNSVPNSSLTLISRANKNEPDSYFNNIYWLGKENTRIPVDSRRWEDWVSGFLPWYANPTVTEEWYEAEKRQQLRLEKHLDDLFTSYPATDVEALAPSTSNKRIMRGWVIGAFEEMEPVEGADKLVEKLINVETLIMYHKPVEGRRYVIGVDAAEGLPTSDNSVIIVCDYDTGEECAIVCDTITPRDTAWDAHRLSLYYNKAGILVERNNHGHSVLVKLEDFNAYILDGPDERSGYNASLQSKIYLWDTVAETFKQVVLEREHIESLLTNTSIQSAKTVPPLLHTSKVSNEIMSIERKTLKAPKGQMDDRAAAFAMAQMARLLDMVHGVQRATYWSF